MLMLRLYLVLTIILLTACGVAESLQPVEEQGGLVRLPADVSMPATVTGTLFLDIEEGNIDDNGVSDFNFGTLTTTDGDLLVSADGDVLRKSKVSSGLVEVVIDGSEKYLGPDEPPTYTIIQIRRKQG